MSFFSPSRTSAILIVLALLAVGCNSYRGTPQKSELTKDRLNQLSFAVAQYIDDWEDTMPPASDTAALKRCLDPYIGHPYDAEKISPQAEALFTAPISEKSFVFNSSLAGVKLAIRTLPDGTRELIDTKVLFYEPTAEWKGKERYVVMQNGMVKSISENIWSITKKESSIP